MNIQIREASASALDEVLSVERAAFGGEEEASLVSALLKDPTALPTLSLLAWNGDRAIGHILFTAAHLIPSPANSPPKTASASLLAPLAVIPEAQKQGVGTQLINHGLQKLSQSGTDLVFVLGYPAYYSQHGFTPAGKLGFEAPFPLSEAQSNAWRVKALHPMILGYIAGQVRCANALNKSEFWVK